MNTFATFASAGGTQLLWAICALLMWPSARRLADKPVGFLIIDLLRTFFLIVVCLYTPLILFSFSCLDMYEAKSEVDNLWLYCFVTTKITLFPCILWAAASFWIHDIARFRPAWRIATCGLFCGTTVCMGCIIWIVFWLPFATSQIQEGLIGLGVSLLVGGVYGWRFWEAHKRSPAPILWYLISFWASVPLWVWGLINAKSHYLGLPDTPPQSDCFVVTAAAQGSPDDVGHTLAITASGKRVTPQLATFWALEELWTRRAPRSHKLFRRGYNVLGYRAATLIKTPRSAHLAYQALKPVERLARHILNTQT